jgi:DNA-binding transcriptional MerR regulator
MRAVGITAAGEITGVEVHTLRYWEREFDPFLNPVRTTGGQRRYRPEDIQTVFLIKRLLRDEMFSIAGAKKYLTKAQAEVRSGLEVRSSDFRKAA